MQTKLVKMGNSHGVRLPKAILKQTGIADSVELTVVDNTVVIAPAENPRAGWAEAAAEMARLGEDALLMPDVFEDEDLSWWVWPEEDARKS